MTRSSIASKEIDVAGDYLLKLLNGKMKFSVKQIDLFKHTFYDVLSKRFMGHWFPEHPNKGTAYRCIRSMNNRIDTVLQKIFHKSNFCLNDVQENFPKEFTIWIDPGEVTIRFGEEGTTCVLYSKHNQELYGGSDGEDDQSSSSSEEDSNVSKNLQLLTITDDLLPLNKQKVITVATASPNLTSFTRNVSSLSSRGPSPSTLSISSTDSMSTTSSSSSQPRRQPQPLFIPTYSCLQSEIIDKDSSSSNSDFLNYPYEQYSQQSNIDISRGSLSFAGSDNAYQQSELYENSSVNSYKTSNNYQLPKAYNLRTGFYNPTNWNNQQEQQQFWPEASIDYSFMYNNDGRY
ncbi:unnamed protein product [Didymodactylos carnosus]|uniref:Anti-proliferative protein domain-containing protein n=1 Tax=Didymodactylos carnosus TaxID=1234261 RepID=A0A814FTG9_9BILA|nr:unnamed protein product [Didymodactylos carnosus]CAF0987326.1 unnamed protein product [Didymodactylos carnosus]CAF3569602.1 unnamed protein product [Didymodactylos carnosus]CAF3759487.1 unnamed protein product [Didymodactylos carnosus]